MATKTEIVKTDQIVGGDTILINGEMMTVSKKLIRHDPFLGTTIHGIPFIETGRTVERVLFPKWYKGEIIAYATQL